MPSVNSQSPSPSVAQLGPRVQMDWKDDRMIGLSWIEPPPPHPTIQGYYVHSHSQFPPQNKTRRLANPDIRKVDLADLEPLTEYWIWVSYYGEKGEGPASEVLRVETDVGSPGPPRILNLTCTEEALQIRWEAPSTFYRSVDFFYISWREENASTFSEVRVPATMNAEQEQEYMLKNLTRNSWYDVGVLAGTKSNVDASIIRRSTYSQLQMIRVTDECTTNPEPESSSAFLIVITLFFALVFVLLIVGMFFWRRLKGDYHYIDDPRAQQSDGSGWEGEDDLEGARPIPAALFPAHAAQLHVDSDIGFSKEYDAIQTLTQDISCSIAMQPDNKHKNRYLNVLPYDHSRVRLRMTRGDRPGTDDYMNGNYIDGFHASRAYIGTQGPLSGTVEAFWQLVWDHGVVVIIMITNLVERGRKKCEQYWPEPGPEQMYGLIQVRTLKEEVRSTHVLRTLTIRRLKPKCLKERQVVQYHYTNWPDHGTPTHALPVLSFVKKSSAANPPSAPPVIVHCSAGVGRTGTYIVLDAMLKQLRCRGDINVFGFLHHIRTQRNFLVQTEEQYIFIHDALVEAIQSGETEIRQGELATYVELLQTEISEGVTLLQLQYELVLTRKVIEGDRSAGMKIPNIPKNRPSAPLPTDISRVLLMPKPGEEGSDYINASFLPGLSKRSEFILTQHPLPTTVPAFWQMVSQHNVERIVLLSPDRQDYPPFYPEPDEAEMRMGGLRVRLIEPPSEPATTDNDISYARHSLALTTPDEDETILDLILAPNWPRAYSSPPTLFELVQLVQDSPATTGPTLVVDKLGGLEGATFCALTTLCNQIDAEERLDVYLVAKLYNELRPGIWPSVDDFAYLYTSLDRLMKGRLTPTLQPNSPVKTSVPSSPITIFDTESPYEEREIYYRKSPCEELEVSDRNSPYEEREIYYRESPCPEAVDRKSPNEVGEFCDRKSPIEQTYFSNRKSPCEQTQLSNGKSHCEEIELSNRMSPSESTQLSNEKSSSEQIQINERKSPCDQTQLSEPVSPCKQTQLSNGKISHDETGLFDRKSPYEEREISYRKSPDTDRETPSPLTVSDKEASPSFADSDATPPTAPLE